jgi:hypothetical protein
VSVCERVFFFSPYIFRWVGFDHLGCYWAEGTSLCNQNQKEKDIKSVSFASSGSVLFCVLGVVCCVWVDGVHMSETFHLPQARPVLCWETTAVSCAARVSTSSAYISPPPFSSLTSCW